jgi:outer membrane protein OmpA-like peptidoglycan-associated protein
MFVSEKEMNKISRVLIGLMLIAGVGVAQAASDDEKLKELERAMNAPSETGMQKPKMRTRAIVFDNQPQAGDPAASQPAQAQPQAAAGPRDCASLSPDVRAVGVDFAIQFNAGSATVSPASEGTLSQISKVLALSPDRCVIVEGHTDVSGNFDKNMALSRDRATSVVNFISTRNGIDRKRLVPVGKGSTETMQNLDARDPKNRRVVFKVVTG